MVTFGLNFFNYFEWFGMEQRREKICLVGGMVNRDKL